MGQIFVLILLGIIVCLMLAFGGFMMRSRRTYTAQEAFMVMGNQITGTLMIGFALIAMILILFLPMGGY
ncbi:hypothetical protein [Mesorhizobium sp. CN2-181]|uniref:hypothetical protein n=1 Tax=Mesorhizobium yinganensis TaxID=3157707 RepID=UPI0032B7F2CE